MKIKEIIREFRAELENLYGDRSKNIILYGSWARGDATLSSAFKREEVVIAILLHHLLS